MERWEELCALAATEEDQDKLLALAREVLDLLEENGPSAFFGRGPISDKRGLVTKGRRFFPRRRASVPISMRSWRVVAQELARETNRDRIVALSLELEQAMLEQGASDQVPKPPVRVEPELERKRKAS
jgi:hypothetical protein